MSDDVGGEHEIGCWDDLEKKKIMIIVERERIVESAGCGSSCVSGSIDQIQIKINFK